MRWRVAAALAVAALAAPPAAAAVERSTVRDQVPLAGLVAPVPCTGDAVLFTRGALHEVFSIAVAPTRVTVWEHAQPHGVQGTDSRGRRYAGVGIVRGRSSSSLVNGQAEVAFVDRFRLVGRGGAPTLTLDETVHLTVTAGGRATAGHDLVRASCA